MLNPMLLIGDIMNRHMTRESLGVCGVPASDDMSPSFWNRGHVPVGPGCADAATSSRQSPVWQARLDTSPLQMESRYDLPSTANTIWSRHSFFHEKGSTRNGKAVSLSIISIWWGSLGERGSGGISTGNQLISTPKGINNESISCILKK